MCLHLPDDRDVEERVCLGCHARVLVVRARLKAQLVYLRVRLGTVEVIALRLRQWSQQGVLA